ncbi:hypothetical protein [Phenylobacterium sp.]|jgi:hypothetical protein|uniref:hypothetical protein n=1 Tax=Phenylobacterium sp. TaxID=1871053 RepID=UPI002F93866F
MSDATYVSYVPASRRAKLREVLQAEETGDLAWRERKGLFRSEFYFSGPPGLARRTHAFVTAWLNRLDT